MSAQVITALAIVTTGCSKGEPGNLAGIDWVAWPAAFVVACWVLVWWLLRGIAIESKLADPARDDDGEEAP